MKEGDSISLKNLQEKGWIISGGFGFDCYIMGKENQHILYDFKKEKIVIYYEDSIGDRNIETDILLKHHSHS